VKDIFRMMITTSIAQIRSARKGKVSIRVVRKRRRGGRLGNTQVK
jgi:hypothetical protein